MNNTTQTIQNVVKPIQFDMAPGGYQVIMMPIQRTIIMSYLAELLPSTVSDPISNFMDQWLLEPMSRERIIELIVSPLLLTDEKQPVHLCELGARGLMVILDSIDDELGDGNIDVPHYHYKEPYAQQIIDSFRFSSTTPTSLPTTKRTTSSLRATW